MTSQWYVSQIWLDNEDQILSYVWRKDPTQILTDNRVKIEINRYDLTKGRIIYRLCNKELDPFFNFHLS
uniref:Translational initiation factor 1 n=1 Tax=Muellerina celastroides TaxID=286087 RepID=A0AA96M0L4_9MAGN|nr:translational initiation factor 1 [Muellerina celastroides]WNR57496.1 translational initiation factor 1 [Muellerina celastroides]